MSEPIVIYDRENERYVQEKQENAVFLSFLYNTVCGRILLKAVFARVWFSQLQACYMRSRHSAKRIPNFMARHGLSGTAEDYDSFQAFFTRRRAYRTSCSARELIAVADARLACYPITSQLRMSLKGSSYSVAELLEDEALAEQFAGGICLVFRLALQDHHRYVFPDDGRIRRTRKMKGLLHTVRPISERYRVYVRNSREWSLLETKHFGSVVQVEIGAMLVGKICNHQQTEFIRLEEKGYFDYGGSTILLLFQKDTIQVDQDLIEHSSGGIETLVHIGERIGVSTC